MLVVKDEEEEDPMMEDARKVRRVHQPCKTKASRQLVRGLQALGSCEELVRVHAPKLQLDAPRKPPGNRGLGAMLEFSDVSMQKKTRKPNQKAANTSTDERSSSWSSTPSAWTKPTTTRSETSALRNAYPNPLCSGSLSEERRQLSLGHAALPKQSEELTEPVDDPEGQRGVGRRSDDTAETSVVNNSERPGGVKEASGKLSGRSSRGRDLEATAPDTPKDREREDMGRTSSRSRRALSTLSRGPAIIVQSTREAAKAKKAIDFTASKLFRKRSRSPPLRLGSQSELNAKHQGAADIAVGTLLFVLVLVFAGLLYALFVRKKDPITSACTDECLSAKRYLNGLINIKYDACEDFYERVCSSWSYRKTSFLQDMIEEATARLNSSLLVANSVAASAQVRHARAVYRSCYKYAASKTRLDDTIRAADEIIRFTSLRRAENWNEVLQFLIRLSLEVGFSTVFSVRFVREKGRALLQISSGASIRQKLDSVAAKDFPKIARDAFGASTETVLGIDLNVSEALTQGTSEDLVEERGSLDSFVRGCIPGLTAIDWIIAVNKVVPKLTRVRMIDIIIARGMTLVREALGALVASRFQNAVEYLVANLEAQIIVVEYMKPQIRSYFAVPEYCLVMTKICTTYSWPQIVAEVLIPTSKYRALEEMFVSIKKALTESPVMSWTSDGNNLKAAEEVAKTALISAHGQPRIASAATDTDDARSISAGGGSSFIGVFLRGVMADHAFRMSNPPSTEDLLLAEKEYESEMPYVPSFRAVVVPSVYQTSHLFYSQRVPANFNYGTVGVLLANAIVVAFGSTAGHTTADGRREPWWSDLEPERSNNTIGCLLQLRLELGFRSRTAEADEKEIDATMTRALSLRLAFQAMRQSFEAVKQNNVFDTQWNEAMRTFFTRFCLLFCTGFSEQGGRESCLLPLYSMEEFSVAFECHTKSFFKGSNCPL
ncbi:hypothetical protein V5799_014044 [Amblyomma americanum]|uniref:Peptidase M13 C-terminal domain-containing protein n=1 Tax=Amblyomma americanum TaxID=6943 RepID=A0AAQ4E458_AMBAM